MLEGVFASRNIAFLGGAGEGPNTGTLVAIRLALPPSHTAQSVLTKTLDPSDLHSFGGIPRQAAVKEILTGPFKRAPGSLAVFRLSLVDRIRDGLHRQILCDHLLSALLLWAGALGRG